jgi:hypothetical protein
MASNLILFLPSSLYFRNEVPMYQARSQYWYHLYASTIVELDAARLIEQVGATEAAINGRLVDLQYDSDHHEERKLMADAQRTLAFLRRHP